MRSWENRSDTTVVDEPLYAHYLQLTGLDHPGADEVMAHHETDCERVIASLVGSVPGNRSIFYQKHMAHHLLPEVSRGWLSEVVHVFLIRSPRAMLASLHAKTPFPSLTDTGLPQQVEIFRRVKERTGTVAPVLDSRELLLNPAAMLSTLCERLGIPFDSDMLTWPAGRRASDGIWAKHWYEKVEQTTEFAPYRETNPELPEELEPLLEQCLEYYEELHQYRIRSSSP